MYSTYIHRAMNRLGLIGRFQSNTQTDRRIKVLGRIKYIFIFEISARRLPKSKVKLEPQPKTLIKD